MFRLIFDSQLLTDKSCALALGRRIVLTQRFYLRPTISIQSMELLSLQVHAFDQLNPFLTPALKGFGSNFKYAPLNAGV